MKNKKGFTLVELLVVIAIIGILSTVAVINLNEARNKAKEGAAKAWVKNLTPYAVLCEDSGGAIINFSSGGAFCTSEPDLLWPVDVPEGYTAAEVASSDAPGVFGDWLIMIDALSPLDGYACSATGCSVIN
jgi:prepilin-type N-terminal cleavage/methylation domain-containing protein